MTLGTGQVAIVLDASVAIPVLQGDLHWLARMQAWLQRGDMLLVPPHFRHEVANALLRSVRLSRDDVTLRIPRLEALGLEVGDRGWLGLLRSVELADRHGLSVYDAAYLDLAIDVDGELATLDQPLRAAAESEGVALTA